MRNPSLSDRKAITSDIMDTIDQFSDDQSRQEANAIYKRFLAPLYKGILYQKIIAWSLFACILCLLILSAPNTHHHVLEQSFNTTLYLAKRTIPNLEGIILSAPALAKESRALEEQQKLGTNP